MALGAIAPASAWQTVDTAAAVPVGTIMRDDANGAEYIYCTGVASLVQFDLVTISSAFAVVRSVAGAAGVCGIAQSAANATTKFCWVALRGTGFTINLGATATAGSIPYLHATAGSISTTTVSGDAVQGMYVTTTGTGATTAKVTITYPFVNTKVG